MIKYSDDEIYQLVTEPKLLPSDWSSKVQCRESKVGKTRNFDIEGARGNKFRVILRQSYFNPLDFSIILGVYPPNSNRLFHLRRYDGKVQQHTNPIEKQTFYDFHIHKATERYQIYGYKEEDKYAEPTDRYSTYGEAFKCLLEDCGFQPPDDPQLSLL